jgi:hypothetical protein
MGDQPFASSVLLAAFVTSVRGFEMALSITPTIIPAKPNVLKSHRFWANWIGRAARASGDGDWVVAQ